jgi:hypothetical protein
MPPPWVENKSSLNGVSKEENQETGAAYFFHVNMVVVPGSPLSTLSKPFGASSVLSKPVS